MRVKERVVPKQPRISRPSKGIGQTGMTRKECVKNPPARMQGGGRVLGRKEGLLSTPITKLARELWDPRQKR